MSLLVLVFFSPFSIAITSLQQMDQLISCAASRLKIYSPVSIPHKSIAGRYRPVRVADGPITARYIFIKNASWVRTCR